MSVVVGLPRVACDGGAATQAAFTDHQTPRAPSAGKSIPAGTAHLAALLASCIVLIALIAVVLLVLVLVEVCKAPDA